MASWIPPGQGTISIKDGSNYHKFMKIASYNYTPATAGTETEQTLDEGESTSIALPGNGEFTFAYQPHPGRQADQKAEADHKAGTSVTIRHLRGPSVGKGELKETLSGAVTIALATDGTITGVGTSFGTGFWQVGAALVDDGDAVLYIIESITSATSAKVARYGAITSKKATKDDTAIAAVAAETGWKLYYPAVEIDYVGRLTVAGGDEGSGAGAVTANATLALESARSIKLVIP